MLNSMFSGWLDTEPSKDGSYFIDRDGTHFRYILNYLRTGQLLVPKDAMVRRELLTEAEFYKVEGVINDLRAGSFKDSLILSSDQCQILMNWLKDTRALKEANLFPCLLYRALWDGWTAANFHSCCDNKGPTVTVIKSGNFIFGGYTEQPWEGRSHFDVPRVLTLLTVICFQLNFSTMLAKKSETPESQIKLSPRGYCVYSWLACDVIIFQNPKLKSHQSFCPHQTLDGEN